MKVNYLNDILTFDIETTSWTTWKDEKHQTIEKHAIMYVAGFTYNGNFSYVRKWDEVVKYFDEISNSVTPDNKIICWVHNLSFEFFFMLPYMKFDDVMALRKRKILTATYKNIEFRCSMLLSNCSLANLAKNEKLPVQKLVGDLDYSLIRHHDTKLTDKDTAYLKNDNLVIYEYIKKKLAQYGSMNNIPLTSTGEVRKYFVDNLEKQGMLEEIHNRAVKYSAHNMELQNLLVQCYSGAYTHASYEIIGKIIENVFCIDISSSYPFQMVSKKYPTEWIEYKGNDKDFLNADNNIYATLGIYKFYNIKVKNIHCPISHHKCLEAIGALCDNGRIHKAKSLTIVLNDIDFEIVSKFYDFEGLEVGSRYISKKEYLPTEIVTLILKLFADKTALKNVVGEEENYMRSKNNINGTYGTTVFNILKNAFEFEVETQQVIKQEKDFKDFKQHVNSKKTYLPYSVGVWVTSYAKQQILLPIYEMGNDALYSDTDSVKYRNKEKYVSLIDSLNKVMKEQFTIAMEHHKKYLKLRYNEEIDNLTKYGKMKKVMSIKEFNKLTRFFTPKGEEKFMGIFDEEEPYKLFKTLGCKRYMVQHMNDGCVDTTVAGAPKTLSEELVEKANGDIIKAFDLFEDGYCSKGTKKCHTYIDDINTFSMLKDYNGVSAIVFERGGVCITSTDFTMSLSEEFKEFLSGKQGEINGEDIYFHFENQYLTK